jgi:hypothetical protein
MGHPAYARRRIESAQHDQRLQPWTNYYNRQRFMVAPATGRQSALRNRYQPLDHLQLPARNPMAIKDTGVTKGTVYCATRRKNRPLSSV